MTASPDNQFAAVVTRNGGTWPVRPPVAGAVLWIGPEPPPIEGAEGATAGDRWLST